MVWSLIILGLLVLTAIVIFVLIKNIIKAVISICIVVFLVFGVLALILFFDSSVTRDNLTNKPNTFVYLDEGNIKAGFSITINGQKIEYLDKEDLDLMNKYYSSKNLDYMLGSDYKLFIVNSSIFNEVGDIKMLNYTISGQFIKESINTNFQETNLLELVLDKLELSVDERQDTKALLLNGTKTQEEFKGKLFGMLIMEKIESGKGAFSLIVEYKKGNVVIYKESATFAFIKELPETLIKGLFPTPKPA